VRLVQIPLSTLSWGVELVDTHDVYVTGIVKSFYSRVGSSEPKVVVDLGGDLGEQVVLCSTYEVADAEYDPETLSAIEHANQAQGGSHCLDSDSSDMDWEVGSNDSGVWDDGYSEGDDDFYPVLAPLIAELGVYGPPPEGETFKERYSDHNWYKRTSKLWQGRPQFRGLVPGPTDTLGDEDLTEFQLFQRFWDDSVMRKIVFETNRYAQSTDAKTGGLKGGPGWRPLTISDLRTWLGKVILMGLKQLPTIRDYWKRSSVEQHCPVIS
jgi:hypothetical protein